jgi:DNA polymerase-1
VSDNEKPTLLIIDGHSLAFRAFYALPVDSFQNREGQHTNAIHGFIAMLINLLQNEKPTHLGVAFDISRFSFRTREYPEYKGTRGETPPEFVGQVPLLEEALAAMGISTISKEDYEADDILATLATQGAEQGYKVLVVSGDRDAIQMVNDDVTLLYPNARGVSELKRYDRDAVFERYGIEPHQYPDIAALVGETSDNLIGIDKVGEKTAVKWITQYGSLNEVLAHADEIKGVVGEKLREQSDRAIRNRKLNHLLCDVVLPVGPNDLQRRPIDERAVREVFAKLLQAIPDAAAAAIPAVRTLVDEELAHWIEKASAGHTTPLALRIERGVEGITGFGLAANHDSAYVPWAPGRPDYTALEAWLAGPAPKVLFDAKADLKALRGVGLDLAGIRFDTRIAAWLLKPGGSTKDLAGQVYDFLGLTLPQSDPNQLVPETGDVSVATEAWYLLEVADYLEDALDETTRGVLDRIELPLVTVLANMELTGITVNAGVLGRLSKELAETAGDLQSRAYAEIGREVNLGSPKQLQQVLFEELGMPKTRANKTGFSTDAASLADLQERNPHPFLDLLLKHRDATKLRQIIETLEKAIEPDHRVHTRYDQTGTSTGRVSSTDPNLQNIPIKTEVGREIRSAFEHGGDFSTLLTADYSQIEMRIMAHLSGDAGLIAAFNEGEDLHRFVGARIFGVAPSEVTPVMRGKVKAMSYGLAYGLSAFGLSKQLRVDTAEAKQLMADYFSRFGAVRDYLRNVVVQARIDGYTETIFGRRRPFGDLNSANRVLRENAERAALNAPIQGSAADIMKIAMLGISDDLAAKGLGSRMLLQVHDELVFEVADGELDELSGIVRQRMGHAAELSVPLDVQIGTGPNWDAAAH